MHCTCMIVLLFACWVIVPRLFEEKWRDSVFPLFGSSVLPSPYRSRYLVGATPPKFYSDSFETSLVFWSWSEDMHVVWIQSSDYFLSLFLQVELSHILGIIYYNLNGQGMPCGRHSSYNFILILLKLHWCFSYGLKICL